MTEPNYAFQDVEYSYIYKMDTSGIPVCMIGMAYDVSPDVDLYDFVNRKIITPLSRIDGIANVDARSRRKGDHH